MKYVYFIFLLVFAIGCQGPMTKNEAKDGGIVELPSSYGIYYWNGGRYHPMQQVIAGQNNNQAPIIENHESGLHLLVYKQNFNASNLSVAFNDWPQKNNRQLNFEVIQLQKQDTYKIEIKDSVPQDGVLLVINSQTNKNTLIPNVYMVLLKDTTITDEERAKKQRLIQEELNSINAIREKLKKRQ